MELDADRRVLRPIDPEVARALLEGRTPEGVTLAPGYPSRLSVEVLEMVVGARRSDAGGGFGPYFMVRKVDGEQVELVVYEATQCEAT
jgi:hypothetical protein